MAQLIVVYWRDIPAQVIAKAGRRNQSKVELHPRFSAAIDAAAMGDGFTDTDQYLAEWRRGDPAPCGDDLAAEAQRVADALEAEYDEDRLRLLVRNKGRLPG
ncbi:MAG: virulence factor [Alphaproteobacteria bacterium]